MRKTYHNNEIDHLASQLIQSFSANARQEAATLSAPFFIKKLQARIKDSGNHSQWWGSGVVSAQNWLVALSLIALLFFISNVVLVQVQPGTRQDAMDTSVSAETDWYHLEEPVLLGNEIGR